MTTPASQFHAGGFLCVGPIRVEGECQWAMRNVEERNVKSLGSRGGVKRRPSPRPSPTGHDLPGPNHARRLVSIEQRGLNPCVADNALAVKVVVRTELKQSRAFDLNVDDVIQIASRSRHWATHAKTCVGLGHHSIMAWSIVWAMWVRSVPFIDHVWMWMVS